MPISGPPIPRNASVTTPSCWHCKPRRHLHLRGNRRGRSGLFDGVRGRQLAGRFVTILTKPFAYSTAAERDRWAQLVDGFDTMLRLRNQYASAATRLAAHLYGRTAGSISFPAQLPPV